ncbi:MAG: hypothetical protein H0X65_17100 [Gemmatimonadetes bacterium]|nr:hypothetical protein [Gemmatimonadota bacterium]
MRALRPLALLLLGLLALPTRSEAQHSAANGKHDCFQRHLREAIELNRERLPLYSQLTDGASERISRRLIWSERLALPVAWYIDRRASGYLQAGIPLVCDEFVSMELTPPFRARAPIAPQPVTTFRPTDTRRVRRAVRGSYRQGGFPGVSAVLEGELRRLEDAPTYHCMLRHLLESALRIANLAPIQAARAEELGMDSPEGLSWLLLRLHLLTLEDAARLDRAAAPLQAEGIPIICQDVPPIAPLPEGWETR